MKRFDCPRCGACYDFVTDEGGRFCADCGAPLTFAGEEPSPWGMDSKVDL